MIGRLRLAALLVLGAGTLLAAGPPALCAAQGGAEELAGTSWRLVQFASMDGSAIVPDDRSKYTIVFGAGGKLSARLDCNRGNGSWQATAAHELRFGPISLTRAACPPGSLHDRMARDWSMIRSYTLRDGHLYLAVMADSGAYEFEPLGSAAPATPGAPAPHGSSNAPPPPGGGMVASKGPIDYDCEGKGGGHETIRATFYETTPALVLVERKKKVLPAFRVAAASGARYEGEDLLFWEAHGETRVTWSEIALTCVPR
jgi:heat shock protein HslJ